jgi:pimeloyl-ACP methyl ester carboxylesterase
LDRAIIRGQMRAGPIEPFRIEIPDAAIDDLRRRLAATRWPPELLDGDDGTWRYGTPLAYLRELVEYWRDGFDWRAAEARLNSFDHFRVEIDGLRVHFVHAHGRTPPGGDPPMPLVITHGWPGSFAEILPMVPALTDPAAHAADPADAFDVVVPSLPGFGFSDPPRRRGEWRETADRWVALMTALGYERFGAQSSDIGSRVMRDLGRAHPERLIGLYLTTDWVDVDAPGADAPSPDEATYLEIDRRWEELEGGYAHEQGTKPQTLAIALNDSPAGLAAWIVEKWRAWSDVRSSPEESFSKDELLTNVSLYWFSQSIGSSFIPYFESRHPTGIPAAWRFIDVPTGVARTPGDEPGPMPFDNARRNYRVVRTHDFPRGGHFAASEVPDLLASEIRHFFRPLRSSA